MDRVLLLTETNKKDWALKAWNENGVTGKIIYRQIPKIFRIVRRICVKKNLKLKRFFYNDWKCDVQKADIIIIHVSSLTLNLPEYINLLNPKARVIAWFWNCVTEDTLPELIIGKCEKWSFDPQNCLDYKMNYNHQYYFSSYVRHSSQLKYDMFYCGKDVGRGNEITKLYRRLVEMGFKVCMKVVNPRYKQMPEKIKAKKPIDYEEIVKYNSQTKAIVEFIRDGQTGGTIRLMESVFFQKKLITNNKYVKKEKFYNDNNIFVIGERPISELKNFMEKPLIQYDQSLLKEYEFSTWINNFIYNKNELTMLENE